MAPGSRLLVFASRWFDPGTVARVFEPLVADWQREWIEVPSWQRPGVWMRGAVAFAVALFSCLPSIIATSVPPSLRNRVAWRLLIFTTFTTLLLSVPLLREVDPPWSQGLLILFALPAAKLLAWAFAMVSAADTIKADGVADHVKRSALLKLGVIATAVMILASGWVVPEVNHQWRMVMYARTDRVEPPHSMRELSTYELITDPARATAHEDDVTNTAARGRAQRELHHRASLALLPLIVLWGRWRALRLPAGHWFSPRSTAVATAALAIGYLAARFSDRFVEEILLLQPGAAAWFPLAILIGVGLLRQRAATHARPAFEEN
jgi:hypothetical protein